MGQLNLTFEGLAEIEHLNIRKEGAEKDVLAVDVKVGGVSPGEVLYQILGCAKAKAATFWDLKSDEQRAAYAGLAQIKCNAEFESCEITIGEKKFVGAKCRRFVVVPANFHKLNLVCQISISDIHDADVGYLCEQIRERVKVEVNGEPGLFDD